MLAKMNHRLSGRKCGWQNSLFKFDHSKATRSMERMAEDSNVRPPEGWSVAEMRRATQDELGVQLDAVHVEHDDRKGAEVADVDAALLWAIDAVLKNQHRLLLVL